MKRQGVPLPIPGQNRFEPMLGNRRGTHPRGCRISVEADPGRYSCTITPARLSSTKPAWSNAAVITARFGTSIR